MEIFRNGSRPSGVGSADWFVGTVRMDPLFAAQAPSATSANTVTFEPGARTHWHTHPLGQMLIITAGQGRVQREGGPLEVVNPGDVVQFAPDERHWHGAGPDVAMTHIAVQESVDGTAVTWAEPVTDFEYDGAP